MVSESATDPKKIIDLYLSQNQNLLVVAYPAQITLYASLTLKPEYTIKTTSVPSRVVLSPKNRFLAYTINTQTLVVDLKKDISYNLNHQVNISEEKFVDQRAWNIYDFNRKSDDKINIIAFSQDEKLLATANHSTVVLNSNLLSNMTSNEAADFANLLSQFSIVIWDLSKMQISSVLTYPNRKLNFVIGMRFSPDSSYLVSWNAIGTGPFVWKLDNKTLYHDLNHIDYSIEEVAFSPDSKQLASISTTGFHVSDLQTGNLISELFHPAESAPKWVSDSFHNWTESTNTKKKLLAQLSA